MLPRLHIRQKALHDQLAAIPADFLLKKLDAFGRISIIRIWQQGADRLFSADSPCVAFMLPARSRRALSM